MNEPRLFRRLGRAIRDYSLIAPGQHVLVGLSGGKDSLALVELLGQWRMRHNRNFTLTAVHVRLGGAGYEADAGYLADFCARNETDFRLVEAPLEPDRDTRRSPCFLCAWTRRKCLFRLARELGATRIALGHHEDDLLRTALMNLTYSGQFATMPARLDFRKFPVSLIRPLCRIAESELSALALSRGYRTAAKRCPYDESGRRRDIGALLAAAEALNPEFRRSLWHALERAGKLVGEAGEETAPQTLK